MSSSSTKLLFIDSDETSAEVWKCMAKVLESLPKFEFFHAADATEALTLMDTVKPDVIVLNLDDDDVDEKEAFIDSLYGQHPPVVIPNEEEKNLIKDSERMIYLNDCESLDGIHKTLHAAATAVSSLQIETGEPANYLH